MNLINVYKLRVNVERGEFLAFNVLCNDIKFNFVNYRFFKFANKTEFSVQNILMNLCVPVLNSQRAFCGKKSNIKSFWYANIIIHFALYIF